MINFRNFRGRFRCEAIQQRISETSGIPSTKDHPTTWHSHIHQLYRCLNSETITNCTTITWQPCDLTQHLLEHAVDCPCCSVDSSPCSPLSSSPRIIYSSRRTCPPAAMTAFVSGSSARLAEGMKDRPIDAAIIGIIDTVEVAD